MIEFTDNLQHAGQRHLYRCRQGIRIDERGLVVEITHEELPGERERLEAFLAEAYGDGG